MQVEVIVARCGLICSKCGSFIRGKCPGCFSGKQAFASCPVKKCTEDRGILNCAACKDFADLKECGKINSFIAKVIGFITKSDRIGKLNRIRTIGLDKFKEENS